MESTSNVTTKMNSNALEFIENVTRNADVVQKQVLSEILTQNSRVEYLQRHGLGGCTDTSSFKRLIPVINYEDILSDINRIASGDKSPILCSQPILQLLKSSGTSAGVNKLIPTMEEELNRKYFFESLPLPIKNQHIPGLDKGKTLFFMFIRSGSTTPGGLLVHSTVTSYYMSPQFLNRPTLNKDYTSPNATILCPDNYQSMYSQLLCGLCLHKEVVQVKALFATGLIQAIKFLESNWPLLCHDIRTGTLNSKITDNLVRESVLTKILKPDTDLADFIEVECSKKSWKGIITRLWPNTKCVEAIVTGTMSQYIQALEHYSNGLPIVSSVYASTECYFGVNLNPLCKPSEVSYTFIPTMAYFEFLPVQRNSMAGDASSDPVAKSLINEKEQQELVDLVDVKLGEEYEVVVTTYTGLYRYRVGDLLRVAGFRNKAPEFNFLCRRNVVLSIDMDKTDEFELQSAVEKAVANHLSPLNATLVDYTAYADTSTIPGHYVVFWEIIVHDNASKTSQVIPSSVFEKCCLAMEESLSIVYRNVRVGGSIGPLEIKIVERGTFDKLMDFSISLGASMSQYKTPRSLKRASFVDILNSKVVSSNFSPKCPTLLAKSCLPLQ